MFLEAVVGAKRIDVLNIAATLELAFGARGRVTEDEAHELWEELSYYGSNDFAYALRGFEGVDYPEIVRDVCKQQKVPGINHGDTDAAVLHNEKALLSHMLSEVWKVMSEEERRELLRGIDIDESELKSKGAKALLGLLAARSRGFITYRVAVTVANAVSRALLGRGLAFGANAALTRGLGVALGPVGIAVSGAFALNDLASPATRKTLPAVLQVALLRTVRAAEGSGTSEAARSKKRAAPRRSTARRVRRKPRDQGGGPEFPLL
jgi:uncharacterized protein YaaW (UPF0174 family)